MTTHTSPGWRRAGAITEIISLSTKNRRTTSPLLLSSPDLGLLSRKKSRPSSERPSLWSTALDDTTWNCDASPLQLGASFAAKGLPGY